MNEWFWIGVSIGMTFNCCALVFLNWRSLKMIREMAGTLDGMVNHIAKAREVITGLRDSMDEAAMISQEAVEYASIWRQLFFTMLQFNLRRDNGTKGV